MSNNKNEMKLNNDKIQTFNYDVNNISTNDSKEEQKVIIETKNWTKNINVLKTLESEKKLKKWIWNSMFADMWIKFF